MRADGVVGGHLVKWVGTDAVDASLASLVAPLGALDLLRWAASTAHGGGIPEQVDRHLLDASFVDEWVERWGPSADPLLWSSAMFLRLAAELGLVEA
jgi:GH15 family glucan-1,4-alpha-glucosidase